MRTTALAGTAILALTLTLTACGGTDDTSGDSMSEESASQSPADDMASDDMASDDMGADDMESEDMGGDEMESDDMDMAVRTGEFEGVDGKTVSGTVEVSDTELVLSGFSSDEAPDLHVYLTDGAEEADVEAGTEIDVVAFDEASQTFALDGMDVTGYDTVVIHCDKAKAVYGAAPLG